MKNSFSVEKAISFLTVTGVSKQVLLPGGGGGHWSPFFYGQLNAFSLVFFNTIIVIGSWIKLPVLLSLRASSPICASEASLMTAREQGRGGFTLTLKMTTAQVVEISVTVNNNSPIFLDYVHQDNQTQPTFKMTAGFKPFTEIQYFGHKYTFQRVLNQIPGGGGLWQATPSVLNENSRGESLK